jgi:hypothetical protein
MPEIPEPVEVGWQVLDPDGNVVQSGTVIVLSATADAGETMSEEI